MPDFPRYESKGSIDIKQPSFLAAEDTSGKQLEAVANAGEKVQQGAFALAKAYKETQKSTAELNQRTQAEDLLTRASSDPDYNSFQKYAQENEKIRKNSLQNLNDPEAIAKANYYQSVTNHQLNGIFQKKMVGHEQGNILQLNKLEEDNPTPGSFERVQERLNQGVKQGFINEKQAATQYQKSEKTIKANMFFNDLFSDANLAQEKVDRNDYKFDAKTKAAAQAKVDYMKKRNQDNLEADMSRREIDDDLTMPEVEAAFKNKLVSRSFYESKKKTLESSLADTAHTDNKVFNDLTSMLVDPGTKPDEARNAILEMSAAGKLSKSDLESLYKMHLIPSDGDRMNLQQALGDTGKNDFEKVKALNDAQDKLMEDKKNWWHSAFQVIDNTLGKDDKTVAAAKQALYGKVDSGNLSGADVVGAAKQVLSEDFLKKHPEVKTYPKEGKVVGGYRYFPDGTAQEEVKK